MRRLIATFLLITLWGSVALHAQEYLSLEEAVSEALAHNYGIQIQRYSEESAENNAYAGGAGLLPQLTLSGGGQYSSSSASGILLQGPEAIQIDTTGIEVTSANASLQLTYTLGVANFRSFRVLQSNVDLSREQTRQTIEGVALQVISAYYNLAKLSNRFRIQEEALQRSQAQLASAKTQQEFGGSNRLAVLNAQVNVQSDSITLVSTQLTYENAIHDLNLLIGSPIDRGYEVDTEVTLGQIPTLDDLQAGLAESNANMLLAASNRKIAELNLSSTRAQRLPTLTLNANYNYNYTDNPFSITPELSNWGPTIGATVNVNLFNGFQLNRQVQAAEINVASSRAQYQQAEQSALRDLANAYLTYQQNQQIYALNQTSLEAATLNYQRTQELFELGQASSVELRQANLNLQQVQNQLNELQFDLKLSEVQLLQVSGQLVRDEELLLDR